MDFFISESNHELVIYIYKLLKVPNRVFPVIQPHRDLCKRAHTLDQWLTQAYPAAVCQDTCYNLPAERATDLKFDSTLRMWDTKK